MTDTATLPPEAQTNEQGYIAVKYRQPGQILITSMPSGTEYVATTRANISMAWVKPEDLAAVMAKKDGCCNKKRQSFTLANVDDVRRWTNGGGQ